MKVDRIRFSIDRIQCILKEVIPAKVELFVNVPLASVTSKIEKRLTQIAVEVSGGFTEVDTAIVTAIQVDVSCYGGTIDVDVRVIEQESKIDVTLHGAYCEPPDIERW